MTVLVLAWIYMIGTMLCIVITLAFDSSPIKGEGVLLVGLSCFVRVRPLPVDTALKPV